MQGRESNDTLRGPGVAGETSDPSHHNDQRYDEQDNGDHHCGAKA